MAPHPDDLRKHVSIHYRFPSGAIYKWRLQQGVNALEVEVDDPLVLNNLDLIAQSAASGLGLAMVFESYAEPFLRNGQLEVVLQDWSIAASRFFVYYPSRRHVPAALRAFIDFVRISHPGKTSQNMHARVIPGGR
jgi:DNA-binding transcriptional LysR family regulator